MGFFRGDIVSFPTTVGIHADCMLTGEFCCYSHPPYHVYLAVLPKQCKHKGDWGCDDKYCIINQPKVHSIPTDPKQCFRCSAHLLAKRQEIKHVQKQKMSFIHVTKKSVEICRKNLQDILHHWTMQVPSQ